MAANDDQKLKELERELDSALDEESISEMLDGYPLSEAHRDKARAEAADDAETKTLELDSETLLNAAPVSEAHDEPPTVEAYVGDAPGAPTPEAAVITRRRRADAGSYPVQPPPVPGESRPDPAARTSRHREPAKPPKIPAKARFKPKPRDLRPAHGLPERRWRLERTPLEAVLLELVGAQGLGLLEVRAGNRRAQLVVDDGQIYEVNLLPTSPKRSLTAFLQKSGKLAADKAAEIRRRADHDGVCEATLLLDEPNLLPASVVRAASCSRTRYLLRRLLEARLSEAAYYELDDAQAASMIVSVPLVGVVFSQVRALHSAKFSGRRDRARERFFGTQLSRKTSAAFSINKLGLKLDERQLVDRVLTKPRPFEKVLANSPVSADETVALLAALEAVGLLEMKAPGLAELAEASWSDDYKEAMERVEVMEARLERENLFALLGLHWTSYDAEVARGYREVAALFDLRNQPLGLAAGERKRVRDVCARLDEVYERLSDADEREAYRRRLVGAKTRKRAAKKLESLANTALARKKLHSALDYYQRLLEVDPQNARASRLMPMLIARTSRRS